MSWIDAEAIVASVADAFFSGIFSPEKEPRCPMGEPAFPSQPNRSVAPVGSDGTVPLPALIRRSDGRLGEKFLPRIIEVELSVSAPSHSGAL